MGNIYYYGNGDNSYKFLQTFNEDPTVYSITVDTARHNLTLLKSGAIFRTYPVAVGKSSTLTPKGSFKIVRKLMKPGGPYGARFLGLNIPRGGYGIHGTNDPSSIGKSISHGCIRMYNKDVIALYNTVPVGTPVTII